MSNFNSTAAALALDSDTSLATSNPYGLDSQADGAPQSAQAIALPQHNDGVANGSGNDFNRDGHIDLYWHNQATGESAIWYLNRGSYLSSQAAGTVNDTNWKMVGTGDLNGDQHNDLIWRNEATGDNAVWYLNNGQYVSSANLTQVGDLNWEIKSVSDMDGDGISDILWRHKQQGLNIVWHMNQSQIREAQYLTTVADVNWEIVGTGDADRDGNLDVFWQNKATGSNLVWYINNNQHIGTGTLGSVADTNWTIEGVEDFDADGKADLLWRNGQTGRTLIWCLDNTTYLEAIDAGTVADTNWRPIISGASPNTQNSFDIDFDYRFDTQGWFTPERRAALEAAADVWESIILDDFETTPAGTATPFVVNPETGDYAGANQIYITDQEIDDLVIFVGARSMSGGTLGQGGASGFYNNQQRYVGNDFEPWAGSISFNSNINWFFDSTPATDNDIPAGNVTDFISTAVHEIGHVLGFSTNINAFSRHLDGAGNFAGPNAMARNGGTAIPLIGSHIVDGHEFGGSGETVMDPVSFTGRRQLPTVLDIAIFDDIGYEVDYSQAAQNQSENRDAGITGDTGSNRMVAHDSSAAPGCCSCDGCQSNYAMPLALVGETSLESMISG